MQPVKKILTIKLPVALATYAIAMRGKRLPSHTYDTNPFIKYITSWLILKAETPYSILYNYKLQADHLSEICQCEKQTLDKRIKWMLQQKIAFIEGANLRLVSYKQLAAVFGIDLKAFKTIHYDPTVQKNLHLQIFAAEIEQSQDRQKYMVHKKLQRNPDLKATVQAEMLKKGATVELINDISYLANGMKKLYTHSFISEPELHFKLNQVRPFVNRCIDTIAYSWLFKHKQLVSYYKKKMQTSGIARIHKGERINSNTRTRNSNCEVKWNEAKGQTLLCICDAIEVIQTKEAA